MVVSKETIGGEHDARSQRPLAASPRLGRGLSPHFCSLRPAFADAGFANWVASFRKARPQKRHLGQHLRPRLPRRDDSIDPKCSRRRATSRSSPHPVWDYFDNRVHENSVAVGRQMAKKWKPWLDKIEARFGVDRNILLAIWSMESNYGEILKNDDVMRNVVRSLATLAYADKKRAKFARTQLIAALKILQSGDIDESHLTGSWAGAMGHTQFIPTSYQAYAVDIDGNGKRDIWNSVPDALATAANLCARTAGRAARPGATRCRCPRGKMPGGSLTLSKWESLGVRAPAARPSRTAPTRRN
jgi:membrane-bound lytic murein transglycosylase B